MRKIKTSQTSTRPNSVPVSLQTMWNIWFITQCTKCKRGKHGGSKVLPTSHVWYWANRQLRASPHFPQLSEIKNPLIKIITATIVNNDPFLWRWCAQPKWAFDAKYLSIMWCPKRTPSDVRVFLDLCPLNSATRKDTISGKQWWFIFTRLFSSEKQ